MMKDGQQVNIKAHQGWMKNQASVLVTRLDSQSWDFRSYFPGWGAITGLQYSTFVCI
jgi:hypothetical protein